VDTRFLLSLSTLTLVSCVGLVTPGASGQSSGSDQSEGHDAGDGGGGGAAGCGLDLYDSGTITDNGEPAPTVGSATGTEVYTPAQVAAAHEQCAEGTGQLVSPATIGGQRAQLASAWLLCSTLNQGEGGTLTSMVFTDDGHWYDLLLDTAGGLVQSTDPDQTGTYSIGTDADASDSAPLTDYNIYTTNQGGGVDGNPVCFETDPRRMRYLIGSTGVFGWFVPLP
jgi:hypothetical protein